MLNTQDVPSSFSGCFKGWRPDTPYGQCDQTARLLSNFWPFTTMKICPVASKIANVDTKVCQILNQIIKNCPNTYKILQKQQNFAKYGHTADGFDPHLRLKHFSSFYQNQMKCLFANHRVMVLPGQKYIGSDTQVEIFRMPTSVIRVGDFMHFGQLFKAFCNN